MDGISLQIDKVIGTDEPSSRLFIIPLLIDWQIPKQCVYNFKEDCEEPITRIYILREPIINGDGTKLNRVGACEKHHQYLLSIDNQKDKLPDKAIAEAEGE